MEKYQKPNWTVTAVTPREDHTLLVTFISGEKKLVDMNELINEGGGFSRLKNVDFFMKAHVDSPTVVWDSKVDIAPESLYSRGIPVK